MGADQKKNCKAASCSFESLCVHMLRRIIVLLAESLCAGGAGERAHI